MNSPNHTDRFLYLDNDRVLAALERVDVLGVLARALELHAAGKVLLPAEASLYWSCPDGTRARSLALPAAVLGEGLEVGLKIINASSGNSTYGLPRASGLLVLFDPVTARIKYLMSAEHVSSARTAGVSALTIAKFAPDAESLAILGAGALARAHLSYCRDILSAVKTIRIFDLDRARAEVLATETRALFSTDTDISVRRSARDAITAAEVVIAVTTTDTPYIEHAWLHPQALVMNVSLDDCTEEVFVRSQLLLVDDWALVSNDQRRLLGRLVELGRICGPHDRASSTACRRIDGEISTFLAKPTSVRSGTVVVNPFGMGISDIALGSAIARIAESSGFGTSLPI
jgi:N-[(2S)-2-amino-2-carboxyethyl]-L-glutamate dehydrogenase